MQHIRLTTPFMGYTYSQLRASNEVGQRCVNTPSRDRSTRDGTMTTLNRTRTTTASVVPTYARHPQRISATLSWSAHQQLLERSDCEGRSVSNLVAFLIEEALGRQLSQ